MREHGNSTKLSGIIYTPESSSGLGCKPVNIWQLACDAGSPKDSRVQIPLQALTFLNSLIVYFIEFR